MPRPAGQSVPLDLAGPIGENPGCAPGIRQAQTCRLESGSEAREGRAGSRKAARLGTRTKAPSMFHRNMKASRIPMSAWNLIGDQAQVTTAADKVTPIRATTFPVDVSACLYA